MICVQIVIHYVPSRSADYTADAYVRPTPTLLPPEERAKRINLNTATFDELITLPGIGEVLAERILPERENCGRFDWVEELYAVEGIGEKKLEAIYDLIYVLPPENNE